MTKSNGKPQPRRFMKYDERIALEICERIMGGEGLVEICRSDDLPAPATVYKWLAVESAFAEAYTRAREAQMEGWSDELREIANDASDDYMERIGRGGVVERVADPETVQRSKLKIDTLKWLMSKLAAKKYGDKVEVELSGSVKMQGMSDAEIEAQTRLLLVDLGVEVAAPLLLTQADEEAEAVPAVDGA